MKYYIQKSLSSIGYGEVIQKLNEKLKEEGFGVLTEIDIQETFKIKLGVDFRKYKILGACNPPYAYKTLEAEIYAGTMLPCNIVVMETDDGNISVSAIDPVASLMAIENPEVTAIAKEIQTKLKKVIAKL